MIGIALAFVVGFVIGVIATVMVANSAGPRW